MAYDNRAEWLASLKEGDDVAVTGRLSVPEIRKVARVTATQVVVEGIIPRFNREFGRQIGYVGDFYGRREIEPITDQIKDEVAREGYVSRLARMDRRWETLATAQLRRIVAILDEEEPTDG